MSIGNSNNVGPYIYTHDGYDLNFRCLDDDGVNYLYTSIKTLIKNERERIHIGNYTEYLTIGPKEVIAKDINIVIDDYDAILVSGGCNEGSVTSTALLIDNILGRLIIRNFSENSITLTVMMQVLYKKR